MTEMDMDWVRVQMTEAKLKRSVGTAILKLMDVWEKMNHTDAVSKEIIEAFGKLALGHALVEPKMDELAGTWIAAQPGQLKVTDIIRVKGNAFDGDLGKMHNGRVGKIVGVRYGDIVVKTIDDKFPALDGAHYSPHMLEVLVR